MELRQLRQFIVVAEELNFRRAALRLCMTQPPLSAAIRRLEAVVGAPLLHRTRASVSLTPAGVVFLREARYLLRQADISVDVARGAAQGSREVLRVKSIDSAMLTLLPALLERFHAAEPGIRLSLSTGSTQEIISALEAGSIDLGVCVPGGASYPNLRTQSLGQERFCLAVPVGHRLAAAGLVRLPELSSERLVTHYPHAASPGYHAAVSAILQQVGAQMQALQSEPDLLATLALVRLGLGIALIPASTRRIAMQGVAYADLRSADGQALGYPVALAVRSEHASAAALQLCRFAAQN
ncbi:LysR family transcriptional regulator [Bordetella genomosp. 13]|uniref:LysR family transcriptional regulator n=1 Tax=Bordetella genomosp. 13 TaxID=463040 RepID=UPI0011A98938|nr:LysR substrate-binding domain-containing protein [Bordetella genomosp. 13]